MKRPVILSAFCNVVSYGALGLLAVGMACTWHHPVKFWVLAAVMLVVLACGMWWGPVSVSADETALSVRRVCGRRTVLPYADIESIVPFAPTMASIRVCASGGFMGYWGWFREYGADVYFGYYGRSSDCFLVTLRSGRRYVIGCSDSPAIVQAVQAHLKR